MDYDLPSIRPQNGHILLIIILIGLFDDIMPLFLRYVHRENIAELMAGHRILELFGHHLFPKKPAGIAMGSIAIHRVLIG